jgi:integrase
MNFRIGNLNGRKVVTFLDENGDRKRHRLNAKTPEEAAIEGFKIFNEYREKVEKGRDWTVAEIWQRYQDKLSNRVSGTKMVSEGKVILPYFGGFRPKDITEELVEEYIATRVNAKTGQPISDGTLWTELGRLRDAISFARKKQLITADDVTYIHRPSKPEPRNKWLTKEEAKLFLQAAEDVPHLFTAIHLLLATAGRVTAVLQLTWDRVDFDNERIDLRIQSELRLKPRAEVPMTKTLKKVLLEAQCSAESEHVVEWNGQPIKSIKGVFGRKANEAELNGVTPHVLRHTAAVWMAAAGCSMERIAQYLGHSDPQITRKVYARFAPDHLRDEADAVELFDLD